MPGELSVAERLFVWTALGEREIQLCFGDITALPPEDKVDFVLVSCFPGDYTPMRGTVLGALQHELGIDVRKMAKKKQEDLRQKFHCWVSRPMKNKSLPYRQLICFERSNLREDPTVAVKEVFRGMMPAFNNVNKSVITPLLATGHQHADEHDMMSTMVTTAAKWMWLGMPLQTLKIVMYCHSLDKTTSGIWSDALKMFKKLKSKIEKVRNIPDEPVIVLDIFLIYSDNNEDEASILQKHLKKVSKKLRIKTMKDVTLTGDKWQHDLFNLMQTVTRVVPILSGGFLSEGLCIDQFNVALCCNRCTKRHLLAPVLVERLVLPSYMNMVQWLDCRSKTDEQFEQTSSTLVEQISSGGATSAGSQYDVFISYSHKQGAVAKSLLERLEALEPKPRVFFDYEQLTTGVAWQETLYRAIDNSRCVVALLSTDYLESAVCQEELNLSLAKHLGKDKTLELVPVLLDTPPDPLPAFCDYVRPVCAAPGEGTGAVCVQVCDALREWLRVGTADPKVFSDVEEILDYDNLSAITREHIYKTHYAFEKDTLHIDTSLPPIKPSKDEPRCDVYISHSARDQKYATFLIEYLQEVDPKVQVYDKTKSAGQEGALLEAARCLVVLLSPAYMNSVKEVEEFNIILSRERKVKDRRIMYVIKIETLTSIKKGLAYFNIVSCDTAFHDDIWWQDADLQKRLWDQHSKVVGVVERKAAALNPCELCPLLKAACDIQKQLECGQYLPEIHHSDVILDSVIRAKQVTMTILEAQDDSQPEESTEDSDVKVTDDPSTFESQTNAEVMTSEEGQGQSTNEGQDDDANKEAEMDKDVQKNLVETELDLPIETSVDDLLEPTTKPHYNGMEDNMQIKAKEAKRVKFQKDVSLILDDKSASGEKRSSKSCIIV